MELDILRHSASHLLAHAVKRLYPDALLAIGPTTKTGFYYDFEFSTPITMADFDKIEQEMTKISKENLRIERFELPRDEAIKLMQEQGQPYKVELINDLPEDEVISFYRSNFYLWQVLIGVVMKKTRCLPAYTVRLLPHEKNWTRISTLWKKQKGVTIIS